MASTADVGHLISPYMASEPLPDYLESWGPGISRPSVFPDDYDDRISKRNIFMFANNPISGAPGPFYVVAKSCQVCARQRQRCDRDSPRCGRCTRFDHACRVVEKGWDPLPSRKISKKIHCRVSDNARSDAGDKLVDDSQSASRNDTRPTRRAAPKPGALAICFPDIPGDTVQEDCASDPTRQPTEKDRTPVVTPSKPRVRLIVSKRISSRTRPKMSKATRIAEKRKTKKPRKEIPVLPRKLKSNLPTRSEKSQWKTIHPVSSSYPLSFARGKAPAGQPRIWATNKEELLAVLPEPADGMACKQTEPPILLIEGSAWPEDAWSNDTIVYSIMKECHIPASDTVAERSPDTFSTSGLDLDATLAYPEDPDETMVEDGDGPMKIIDSDMAVDLGLSVALAHKGHELNLSYPSEASSHKSNTQNDPDADKEKSNLQLGYPEMLTLDGLASSTACQQRPSQTLDTSSMERYLDKSAESASISVATSHVPTGLTGAFGPQVLQISFLGGLQYPIGPDRDLPEEEQGGMDYWNYQHARWSESYKLSSNMPRSSLRAKSESEISQSSAQSRSIVGNMLWTNVPPGTEEPEFNRTLIHSTLVNAPWRRVIPPKPYNYQFHHGPIAHVDDPHLHIPRAPSPYSEEELAYPDESANPSDPPTGDITHVEPDPIAPHTPMDIPTSTRTISVRQAPSSIDTPYPTGSIPPDPEDIQNLKDAKESQIPVSLIITRNAMITPFDLPEQYGCVFLGFFDIKNVKSEVIDSPSDFTGFVKHRVRWTFTFKWIPGGEVDYSSPQPSVPWWMPEPLASADDDDMMIMHPFSILPPLFSLPPSRDVGPTASEPIVRKGWHCRTCGKLNVQRCFSFQRCSECCTANEMSPVGAIYVRNPYNTAPITFPWDRYPSSVICTSLKNEDSGMRTFIYEIGTAIVVKHFFTCNQKSPQEDASSLFRDFQLTDKLKWQDARTALATGPYFTYLAGHGHENNHTSEPWKRVPPCVAKSRGIMESLMQSGGSGTLKNLTILAWYATGLRKSPTPLCAKSHKIAIMSLGADVELTLVPLSKISTKLNVVSNPGGSDIAAACVVDNPDGSNLIDAPVVDQPELPGNGAPEGMDEENDNDVSVAGLLHDVHQTELADAVPVDILAEQEPPHKKARVRKSSSEEIFITMVHGDMLQLSGDNFNWQMKRTGMSVVLIGVAE